jgi:hypothetical protein
MEPLMSHTSTMGRGRKVRRSQRQRSASPPLASAWRSMTRAAGRCPLRPTRLRRDRRRASLGRSASSIACASRVSSTLSEAKSALRSTSR